MIRPRKLWTLSAVSAFSVWSVFAMWSKNSTSKNEFSSIFVQQRSSSLSSASSSHSTSTLWDVVAPVAFQTDENGFLRLSDKVRTLVIDVGARDSDYLSAMEQAKDPTVALILVDPFPDSAIPLQQRASAYSMLDIGQDHQRNLDVEKARQVFMIKAALGPEEGIRQFNIALGPACGSLLEQSNASNFWCSVSKQKIQVVVLTLEGLLQRIPPFVESFHLKVDAEGADLMVLQGCKDSIRKFHTVIIECTDTDDNQTVVHDGGCSLSAARKHMGSYGFLTEWEVQGGNGNAYFVNRNITTPFPDFLAKQPGLTFGRWYGEKARQMVAAAAATPF